MRGHIVLFCKGREIEVPMESKEKTNQILRVADTKTKIQGRF